MSHNITTKTQYYIQNKEARYLGNAPIWWARGGQGYTAYVLNAERFSEQDAKKLVQQNPEKLAMFECDYIDARLHLVFDHQDFSRLGTSEPCGWAGGYAEHPERRPPAIVSQVLEEVRKATLKFPTWPTDPLHAVAVLGEEFGELTKATLQHIYEPHKSTAEDVRTEAIQTAAMAFRFLMSLETYQFNQGQQHKQGAEA